MVFFLKRWPKLLASKPETNPETWYVKKNFK